MWCVESKIGGCARGAALVDAAAQPAHGRVFGANGTGPGTREEAWAALTTVTDSPAIRSVDLRQGHRLVKGLRAASASRRSRPTDPGLSRSALKAGGARSAPGGVEHRVVVGGSPVTAPGHAGPKRRAAPLAGLTLRRASPSCSGGRWPSKSSWHSSRHARAGCEESFGSRNELRSM